MVATQFHEKTGTQEKTHILRGRRPWALELDCGPASLSEKRNQLPLGIHRDLRKIRRPPRLGTLLTHGVTPGRHSYEVSVYMEAGVSQPH